MNKYTTEEKKWWGPKPHYREESHGPTSAFPPLPEKKWEGRSTIRRRLAHANSGDRSQGNGTKHLTIPSVAQSRTRVFPIPPGLIVTW